MSQGEDDNGQFFVGQAVGQGETHRMAEESQPPGKASRRKRQRHRITEGGQRDRGSKGLRVPSVGWRSRWGRVGHKTGRAGS